MGSTSPFAKEPPHYTKLKADIHRVVLKESEVFVYRRTVGSLLFRLNIGESRQFHCIESPLDLSIQLRHAALALTSRLHRGQIAELHFFGFRGQDITDSLPNFDKRFLRHV
jgi:hypothetical protein